MTRLKLHIIAIVAATSMLTVAAHAQGTAEERSACMSDAFKFCAAEIPNVSKIEACLQANKSKLAPACQAEFDDNVQQANGLQTKMTPAHFSSK